MAPAVMPGVPGPGPGPGPAPKTKDGEKISPPKPGEEALQPTPATILVSLPADATLTIDGTATKSTSASRLFSSPALEPGKDFHYTLKAEIVRDGKTVTTSKHVTVRAGEETKVELEFPVAAVAQR